LKNISTVALLTAPYQRWPAAESRLFFAQLAVFRMTDFSAFVIRAVRILPLGRPWYQFGDFCLVTAIPSLECTSIETLTYRKWLPSTQSTESGHSIRARRLIWHLWTTRR
jgi:hypothetical protein